MWIAWLLMACGGDDGGLNVQILPESPVTTSDLFAEVTGEGSPDGFWQWRLDGEIQADLLGPVVPSSRTQNGERWKVEITGTSGETASGSVEVGNSLPEVSVYLPTYTALTSGVEALATTVDADEDQITLTWSWRLNGTDVAFEGPTIGAEELAASQIWSVSVIPCDVEGCGEAVTAKTTVADQPPEVTALSIQPEEPNARNTLSAQVDGFDPEGEMLAWHYIWEVDGKVVQEGTTDDLSPGSFGRGSVVRLIVQATAGGQTDQFATSVTIENAAPEAETVWLEPSIPTVAGPVKCFYEMSDPDGDEVSADIHWLVNMMHVYDGEEIPGDQGLFVRNDLLGCVVTLFDGLDQGPEMASVQTMVGNAAPRIDIAEIVPEIPQEGEEIRVAYAISDPENDPTYVDYLWEINGVVVGATSLLSPSMVFDEAVIKVTLSPWDWGAVYGEDVVLQAVVGLRGDSFVFTESTATTVSSTTTTPEVGDVTVASAEISPSTIFTNTVVEMLVELEDPSATKSGLRYQWFVNGVDIPVVTKTLSDTNWFAKGDYVRGAVSGDDGGFWSYAEGITVSNSLPVVGPIFVSPQGVYETSVLGCMISSATDIDPEDRPGVQVSWLVNGEEVSSEDALDGSFFDAGDEVVCVGVASDGEDDSIPNYSEPQVVRNSPPESRLELIPDRPEEGEAVQCVVWTDDPDGDDVETTVTWTHYGDVVTDTETTEILGDTLPAGVFDGETGWSCTAVGDDGTIAGFPATVDAPSVVPFGSNILVLISDDTGRDKVSAYDVHPSPPSTPRIDALADEGIRFDNAYAYPSCSPTRAATLTGRYGRRTGIAAAFGLNGVTWELADDETLIPEMLELGDVLEYSTSAVGKWHLAGAAAPSFYDHAENNGFDYWAGVGGNLDYTSFTEYSGLTGYYLWEKATRGADDVAIVDEYTTTVQTDDALARIDAMPEPWLMWVAYNAPHTPVHEPPAELLAEALAGGESGPELYDAATEALDAEMGRLLDSIPLDVLERTTVIYFGDNGTDAAGVVAPSSAARAKWSLYEGGVGVPFVIWGAGVEDGGRVSTDLVHVVDVFSTVADIAGVPLSRVRDPAVSERPQALDGHSLLPLMQDDSASHPREYLYAERFAPMGEPPFIQYDERAMFDGTYKYMQSPAYDLLYKVEGGLEGDDLLVGGGLDAEEEAAMLLLPELMERYSSTLRRTGH